jgi:group I intron endonuclease
MLRKEMMKVIQLYLITNTCNDKKYVGFTELGLPKRWAKHLKDSQNPKYPLHRAIAKYGSEKFTMVSIYESFDKKHIADMEEYFIQTFDSRNNGYNIALGGRGGNLGPVANQKRSQTMLNRTQAEKDYFRELMRPIRQEVMNRPEVKDYRSTLMKGNQYALGHRHSEDQKLQWSMDRKGLTKSEITKQRMAQSATERNTGARFRVRLCCVCCKREWDLGNYTQHIRKGIKK